MARTKKAVAPRRVLVVDDHAVFAELITFALGELADFRCVGSAASVGAALRVASELRPDVVIVDLMLGDEDGLDLVRQLRADRADVVLVVVSARSEAGILASAAAAGANGFAAKSGAFGETVEVLRRACPGSVYVARSLLALAIAPAPDRGTLTDRETDVLELMAGGASATQIARSLNISMSTCRGHVRAVHRKLGASTQLEAVVKAQQHGLVAPFQYA